MHSLPTKIIPWWYIGILRFYNMDLRHFGQIVLKGIFKIYL